MLYKDNKSIDTIDPQYLTFRHNNTEAVATSGRSIYSHRFDYKSLQKYPVFDIANSERDNINERTHAKIKHVMKQKHLRTVKSQQKYRELINDQSINAEQKYDEVHNIQVSDSQKFNDSNAEQSSLTAYNNNKIPKQTKQKPQKNYANNQSTQANERNGALKIKLNKLIKSMKKEQKLELQFDQQIYQIQQQIETYNKEIEQQEINLSQLKQISQQNMKQCNRIIDHIKKTGRQNEQVAKSLQDLEQSVDSSQISMQMSKQEETKDNQVCFKMRQEINDLIKIKSLMENKIMKLQEQIQVMQSQIEYTNVQQYQMLRIFQVDKQATSGYNQNYSNSHSYQSSSGSNRQSLYYS